VHGGFLGGCRLFEGKREKPPELSLWRLRISEGGSEDYGAPRPGMGEAMTEIDFTAQAEHDTG